MVNIVRRADWGARFAIPGNRHVAPSSRRWFVVHWPGSAVGGDERAVVRSIEASHRNGQGWQAAPGYNFLIGRSGTIYEGCGRDVRGIHSPPRNTDGWGVCVLIAVGETPPQAALNATRALYNHLNGVAGRTLSMAGHNTHFATACPGPALTQWVRNGMPATGGAAPAPPPAPRPPVGNAPPLRVDWFGRTRNSRVPDVRVWQQRMRDRGWRGTGPGGLIAADQIFGPDSERVARQFQQMFGLRVTGAVGPETWPAAWNQPVR